MKTAVKSERIYTENGLKNGYLILDGKKITEITQEKPENIEIIDCGNNRIIPGIFDTHNHGTHGFVLKETDESKMEAIVKGYLKALASQGVTSIFPTCSIEMIGTISQMADQENDGARILGIHSEGPWLNRVGEKGIKTGWPKVSLDTAKKMVEDGKGKLRLVAAAPEIEGIEEILEYFKSEGVHLAYAHSELFYEEASKAIQKHYSVATHLGNVMTGMHHRDIGGLGACLLDEHIDYEIICDGLHISLKMLEIFFRINDYSRFMMISDCSGLAGAPVGKYKGWNESMTIHMSEEGFLLSDTGRLCGSSKSVLFGVGNLVEKMQIPMETVLTMSSLNPCRKYGFDKEKGSITAGKDADFVVIDDEYNVIKTYSEGRKVFDHQTDTNLFNEEYLNSMKL